MTQEEKAKAYDKAIEKAKEICSKVKGITARNVVEELFPKLKESEDERIRKSIIELLNEVHSTFKYYDINKMRAWLEKQGEQKPPIIDFKAKDWYVSKVDGKIYDMTYNPTDKVGPMFKVGDWIIKNNDSPINIDYSCCKVTKVENGNYTIESIYGYKGYNTFETFENDYHLWTIQDAKDGDVLACENGWTCIFNCLNDNLFSSHCFVDDEGWFCEDGGQGHTLDNGICGEIHPATKEQRDLLFQKMKENGYEWDGEKKELKRIEQKSTWSEEDEDMIQALNACIDAAIKRGFYKGFYSRHSRGSN